MPSWDLLKYAWDQFYPLFGYAAASVSQVFDQIYNVVMHFVFGWIYYLFNPSTLASAALWLVQMWWALCRAVLPQAFVDRVDTVFQLLGSIDWAAGIDGVHFLVNSFVSWNVVVICFTTVMVVFFVSLLIHFVIWILSMVWSNPS